MTSHTDSYRLVHGESDRLPGLVVDRYGEYLVIQLLSIGAEYWRDHIITSLVELLNPVGIFERSDVDIRRLEGLDERSGPIFGKEPDPWVILVDKDLKFWVDIKTGHKTGFYLDQRDNRRLIGLLAVERDVLDCFCYSGGFTCHALANNARSVLSVDSSAEALDMARANIALNGLPEDRFGCIQGDVFVELRRLRDQNRKFDLIILDPPKFAPAASQVEKAARGYKDINLLALKLLRKDGILATFSCSGGVSMELFQKIVAGAALDAGIAAQIVGRMHQATDHPVALSFPEGEYLKGLLIQI